MDISGDINFIKDFFGIEYEFKILGGNIGYNRLKKKQSNVKFKKRDTNWDVNRKIDPITFIADEHIDIWKKDNPDLVKDAAVLRDDIKNSLEYKQGVKYNQETVWRRKFAHNGQRKLFLTELQHLTEYLDHPTEPAIVIYAGSAPSNKANMYAKLFPNVKFLFVDPNEFNIYINKFHDSHYGYPGEQVIYMSISMYNYKIYKLDNEGDKKQICHYRNPTFVLDKEKMVSSVTWDEESMIDFILSTNYRFYLFEEYMTRDVAKSFNKLIKKFNGKVLFWSDIRTNFKANEYATDESPDDTDIVANTAMNYVWLKTLIDGYKGKLYSMLKFRLPYLNTKNIEWSAFKSQLDEAKELGVDYEDLFENHKIIKWFKGKIYNQAFSGHKSTEMRLWSDIDELNDDLVVWDITKHDNIMFYYNMIQKFGNYHGNPYAEKSIGFDECGDCAIEGSIWNQFYTKYYPDLPDNIRKKKIIKHVVEIGSITGRNLMREPHGHQYIENQSSHLLGGGRGGFKQYGNNYKKKYEHWESNKVLKPGEIVPNYFKQDWKDSDPSNIKKPPVKREDIDGSIPFVPHVPVEGLYSKMKWICHNGQRKLFLTELHHMIRNFDTIDQNAIVIYAGSAPSNKAYMYAKLFPNVKFLFVDPNEFNIYINKFHDSHYGYPGEQIIYMYASSYNNRYKIDGDKLICHYEDINKKIDKVLLDKDLRWKEDEMIDFILSTNYRFYLFEEYMTRDVAKSFNKLIKKANVKVLFWSDIRTNVNEGIGDNTLSPEDTDIVADAAMNYVWLKTLIDGYKGELYSMLKFRLPFFDSNAVYWDIFKQQLDEAKELGADCKTWFEKNQEMRWFKGKIYNQAFSGNKSTEMRLWSTVEDLRDEMEVYNLESINNHDSICFYYNMVSRFGHYFNNPYSEKNIGFDQCGDCAVEGSIWNEFYDKFYPNFSEEVRKKKIIKHVVEIGSITGRNLMREPHGHQFYSK